MARPEIYRCEWARGGDAEYIRYHDAEWGVPVYDDPVHFEFLILEGAQAGLSWATVLKKRGGYRAAFADFNPEKVARYTPRKVEALIGNPAIIRNRAKIESAVTNARAFLRVAEEFGSFAAYIWRFVDGKPRRPRRRSAAEVPATSPESDALAKDLKARGFKFVGSTIMHAHLQATGLINDHEWRCFRRAECDALARRA